MLDEEKKTLSQVRLEKAEETKSAVEKAEEFVKVISEYLNSIY